MTNAPVAKKPKAKTAAAKPAKAPASTAKKAVKPAVAGPRRTPPAAVEKAAAGKKQAPEKAAKAPKIKLVRDGFTIPEDEYALIADLKKRLLTQGIAAKKTEILRAALKSLAAQTNAKVIQAIAQLPVIKAGRPGKAG